MSQVIVWTDHQVCGMKQIEHTQQPSQKGVTQSSTDLFLYLLSSGNAYG